MESPHSSFKRAAATLFLAACLTAGFATGQNVLPVTTPRQAFGFNIGDDYVVVNYSQMESYWKRLAAESDRILLTDIGPTAEGRRQLMAIVSSPANLARLDLYKSIARRLALAEDLSEDEAAALARAGKAVVWIDGGLHATETVGSQQLIEMVYQMVSRTDPETLRFLDDVIQLYVPANPDGQELVANWYMREPDPLKRSLANLPRLYQKYVGHDNNRDFFLAAMPETINMNRQMYLEWFPQIVYNHHQSGPAGAVVFIPPFRDPFNYNFDPLIPLGVEAVGAAMHTRLVAEGKAGSAMRSGASYSTWWNGGLRTTAYFHNMIGILTEIIGNPTPMEIPLVPDKQLPQGDWPMPIAPGRWHYRQSIDYEISQNRAVLDYASRNRETLLMNIYRMGRNAIERGSRDSWTITPKRIAALKAAAGGNRVPPELYDTILHDPKLRDPRGYILPSNQRDFPTAVKFVNALLKNGITVLRARSDFRVAGKTYPAGSFIVKTAQAFRPHVLDMFEPQDHPDDFRYPGGPPVPPYDITGWTLALQMGVEFDRVLDGFDGPFERVTGLVAPPPAPLTGSPAPGAYCIGHETNDAFIAVNRLLKAGHTVSWMQNTAAFCTPASDSAREILTTAAATLGLPVTAAERMPAGPAKQLRLPRLGLYDQYGGLITSGWTRYVLEQFEFPYEVVYPATLDAGSLRSRFDVLLLPDNAYQERGGSGPRPETIPEDYRPMLGRITADRTAPQLKAFLESGGTLLAIGSSVNLAPLLGVPLLNHLTVLTPEGAERGLTREEFYIPGSLLRVQVDTSHPLAHGMPSEAVVFFDSSPVFRQEAPGARNVVTFGTTPALVSGWAWKPEHLAGGTAVAEAPAGEGKLLLYGPEVTFRAQPHGTFRLLFNGIYLGAATDALLP
jgi:hypothetical protein